MNKIYKVIFNQSTQQLQVVSELATNQSKVSSTGGTAQSQESASAKAKKSSSTDKRQKLTNVIRIGVMGSGVLLGADAMAATFTGNTLQALRTELNTVFAPYCITTVAQSAVHPTHQGLTITNDATILGMGAVAYTNTSEVSRGSATAIGRNANAAGHSDVAIGSGAKTGHHAENGWASVAIGNRSTSNNLGTVAIGENANSTNQASMAIGVNTVSSGVFSTAIASCSTANATGAVAIGAVANATKDFATAIGTWANAVAEESTAIGRSANAAEHSATVIGSQAKSLSRDTVVVGSNANITTGARSISIGYNSTATVGSATVIGSTAVSGTQTGSVVIGNNAQGHTVGTTDAQRGLSNHNNYNNRYNSLTNNTTGFVQKDGQNVASSVVVVGNNAVAHGGGVAIGDGAQSIREVGALGVAIGANAVGKSGGIAIGSSTIAEGQNSFALGRQAAAVGAASQAIGSASAAVGSGSTAIGHSSQALGNRSIAFGSSTSNQQFNEATATIVRSDNAIGIGSNVRVGTNAAGSIAMGMDAVIADNAERSIAIGMGSNASGSQSIAIGVGNRVSGNNAGAFGDPSIVAGEGSYTVGNDNAIGATSTNTGAFGNNNQIGATATYDAAGKLQTTNGLANPTDASGSRAVGNNNAITTKDTYVLGSGINTAADGKTLLGQTVANSVYLGNDSTVTAAAGRNATLNSATAGTTTTGGATGVVNQATVNGVTYSGFAGSTAVGAVSVGAAGAERRIQNVAAGQISATSTDAINGSQLYLATDQLAKGWKIGNATGAVGDVKIGQNPSNQVNFVGSNGTTVNVTGANGVYTVDISSSATSTKVEVGHTTSVGNGPIASNAPLEVVTDTKDGSTTYTVKAVTTTFLHNANGSVQKPSQSTNRLANASSIADAINNSGFTVKANTETAGELINPGDSVTFKQGQNIEVTRAGSEFTIKTANDVTFNNVTTSNLTVNNGGAVNMGNNVVTNVANGTNLTDAVNVQQLNAAKTEVEAGKNVTVDTKKGDNEQTIYTINAKDTTASVAAGSEQYVTVTKGATNADGVTDYAVGLTEEAIKSFTDDKNTHTGVKAADNGAVSVTKQDAADAGDERTYVVDLTAETKAQIAKEESVTAGDNLTVNQDKLNDTQGKNYHVTLNKNIDLTDTGSVTIGGTTLNQGGLTINNGPTFTTNKVDVAGNTITNVANGTNLTDAVNVQQLNAAKTEVEAGKNVTVDTKKGDNEQTIYTINAKDTTASVAAGSEQYVTVTKGATNADGVTDYAVGLTEEAIKSFTDDKNTHTGVKAADNGAVSVTKQDAADAGDERTYVVDLTAETKAQIAKEESVTAGDNLTVNQDKLNDTQGKNYHVTLNKNIDLTNTGSVKMGDTTINNEGITINNGPTFTTNKVDVAGNTITNVANGTNLTDAVNVQQLNAAKTEVEAGKNVTVDTKKGDNEQTIYTINAKDTTASVAAGSEQYVTVTKGATNADGVTDYAVGLTEEAITAITTDANTHTGVKAADGGAVAVKQLDTAAEGDERTYEVDLTAETKAQIAKEESVTAGDNLTVNQDKLNDTQGKNYHVTLNKNIDLTNTGSVKMGDTTINNEGITINNGPTFTTNKVDVAGNTITNVANGTNLTDAVNVQQLNAAKTEVEAGKNVTVDTKKGDNEQTIYTINAKDTTASVAAGSEQYVTVTKGATNADGVTDYAVGLTEEAIKSFTDDKNTHTGVKAADNGAVSVTKQDAADAGDERTYVVDLTAETKAQIAKEESVTAGDNLTVNQDKLNDTQGKNYHVTLNKNIDLTDTGSVTIGGTTLNQGGLTINNGPTFTTNKVDVAGNTITNVANGTNLTDAVNVQQLNAAKTEVEAGKNVTVDTKKGDNEQTIYTINAKDTTASVAAGSEQYVTVTKGATNADGVTDYAVGLTEEAIKSFTDDKNTHTGVKAADNGAVSVTKQDAADAGDERTYVVDLTAETKAQIAKEESVTAGDNLTVNQDKLNDTQGKNYHVTLNKNIDLTDTGSVTIGGTTLNQGGLTINNGPTFTTNKVDVAGNTITNVANGTNLTDAVNVQQLNAAKTEVEAGKNVTVDTKKGDNEQTIYTINAKDTTASVAAGSEQYVTVTKGATNADGVTDYAVGLTEEAITAITTDANTHTGVKAADGGAVAVKQLDTAAEGDERTYEVDLTAETKAQIAKEESVTAGDNLTVNQDKLNDTKGKNYHVTLNKNIDLTDTGSVTIGGTTLNQGGLTINNGPTFTTNKVDVAGNTITNVANGTNLTDAVNVQQLNAAKTEVEAGKNVTVDTKKGDNEQTIYTINAKDTTASVAAGSEQYVTVTKGATNADGVTDYAVGLTEEAIKSFTDDKNTHTGVKAADNGAVSVTKQDAADAGDERTYVVDLTAETKAQIAKEESVTAGDNLTVNQDKLNDTQGKNYHVTLNKNIDLTDTGSVTIGGTTLNQGGLTINNGPTFTTNKVDVAGNTITNVANGTNLTDAVNVQQLNAAKTEVEAGKNVTVDTKKGDNEQTIYTINAKDTTASVAAGSEQYVTVTKGATNADGVTDYAVGLTEEAIKSFTDDKNTHTGVKAADNGAVSVTKQDAADAGDERTYVVDLTAETKAQIAKEESVTAGDNLTVNQDKLNDTQGKNYHVTLNKNIDLTDTGSVTIGGTTLNQGGLTINNGPTFTTNKVDVAGNTITNVANGTNLTDAVNVQQLNAAKTEVEAGKNVTVDTKKGDNEQTIYTINAKDTTASVAAGSEQYVTVTKGATNADGVTDYAVGLTEEAIKSFTDDKNTHTGVKAADNGAVSVTKQDAADAGDERTYVVDLTAETKAQIAKEESVTAGDNLTVNQDKLNDTQGKNYHVTLNKNIDLTNTGSVKMGDTTINNEGITINNGPTFTTNKVDVAGNTITNVANGTNLTDAVNVQQLNAAKTEVEAGKNVTVDTKKGDNEQTIYTINAKDTTASVAAGSEQYVTVTKGATNADGVTDYAVGLTEEAIKSFTDDKNTHTGVKAADNGAVSVTKQDAADAGDERTYVVDLTAETKAQIAKEESVTAGDNLTVNQDKLNDTKGKNYHVTLNKNIDLTDTGSVTIGGTTLNQGGLTINNGPTFTTNKVDVAGNTITNVANGTNLTDAVNVQQLNAAKTEVEAGKNVTVDTKKGDNEQTIYTINAKDTTASVAAGSEQYVTVTKGATNADGVTDYAVGLTEEAIKSFTDDKNTHTGVKAADNGAVSVTKQDAADAGDERTYVVDLTAETKAQIAKEESVTAGDNLTVNQDKLNDTQGKNYHVTLNKNIDLTDTGSVTIGGTTLNQGGLTINNGPTFTTNKVDVAGNTITNVANGTNLTDAVNVQQLNAAKTEVEAGKNVTVDTKKGDNEQTIYTINAKDTTASVAAGSEQYVTVTKGATNADGVTDYAVGLTEEAIKSFTDDKNTHTGVKAADNGAVSVTKQDAADAGDERTYVVDLTAETKAQIAKEESVTAGDNLTVNQDKLNDTQGKNYHVTLNKNIDLTNTGSVKMGDTTINNEGITINNGPTFTTNKVDVAGNTITNVANGTNLTDAVNVQQLNAAKTEVEAGKNVTVDTKKGDNEQTIYTINAKDTTASVAAGSEQYVTVTKGATNADGVTDYAVGLTEEAIKSFTDDKNTHTGVKAADNGAVSVTKQDAADAGDERTYVVDLTAETKAQIAKEESVTAGDNLTVNQDKLNDTQGKNYHVTLNKNIDLTDTGSVTIGGTTLNQGGLTINNGPTFTTNKVDVAGNTITNVANGTNLTDAVNVQQLNAAKTEVEAGKNVTVDTKKGDNEQTIYTINAKDTTASVAAGSEQYVTVTKGATNADGVTDYAVGLTEEAITAITTDANTHTGVKAADGGAVAVKQLDTAAEGDERTYEVDLTAETKAQIAKEESVTAGDNLTVNQDKLNDTKGKNYHVTLNKNIDLTDTGSVTIGGTTLNQGGLTINNGPTFTTNKVDVAGNTITNVANGTNLTDAVNVQQLNAAKTEVAGSGLANVTNSTGANGQTIYNVDVAKADVPTVARGNVTVKAGDENKVMTAGDVANAITGSEKTSSVKAGSDALTVKVGTEDANGNTEYTVDLSADLKTQIAKEETVVAGNNNLTVTSEKTNSTGGKEFVVTLSNNLELGDTGSVKMGNTTINNDGLTINNGPSVTSTGINAGDKKITGVAAGEADTDAVNVSQLNKAINTAVTASQEDVVSTDGSISVQREVNPVTKATTFDVSVNVDNTTITKDKDGQLTANTVVLTNDATGKVNNPTVGGQDAGQSLVTAQTVVDAINNSGFNLKTSATTGGSKAVDGTANDGELINPSNTVEMIAGKNLTVKQDLDGKITFATESNVTFSNLFTDTITIPVLGDNHVVINNNGINAGDQFVTHVRGNFDGAAPNTTAPTTVSTGTPTSVNNAATVGDVLNAGWNLQNNGEARDFVRHADAVNFTNGRGTTVSVTTNNDGTVNNIQVDSALGYVNTDATDTSTPSNTVKVFGNDNAPVQVTNVASGVRTEAPVVDSRAPTLAEQAQIAQAVMTARGDTLNNAVNVGDLQATVNGLANNVNVALGDVNNRIGQVDRSAKAGIASAMAFEEAPFVPGKWTYAAGAAHYGGEQAVAVTLRKTADNGRWAFSGGVSTASEGDAGFRIGISGVID